MVDLDNTLWGGVIGDDGLSGIEIGQGSAAGEAYLAFQRYLKSLQERGVLLAVCSKNEPATAELPFAQHPDMVLKRGRFLTPADIEESRRVVVIGGEIRQNLFSERIPLGERVRIRGIEFTVIGAAANEAARVEALCKSLGTPLVVSEPVARQTRHAWRALGSHALRGVEKPLALFTL